MKKNSYDFSQPTRQSYVAILIITYRLYKIIVKQLFPIFILVLIQGKLGKSQWFVYFIIGIATIGAIYSIFAFFKYYFYLQSDKLIVKKGVFKKTILEIPFDRIQSINTEQNLIHRLFNVVKLNVDTAGSASDELQLNALDNNIALQLSELILKGKKESKSGPDQFKSDSQKEVIFNLSLGQLLKVGITENHLRSGGIIIFFFLYIFDSLDDYGFDFLEETEKYIPIAQEIIQSLIVLLILVFLFAIISVIFSFVRTILRYYNLHMYRKGEGFVIKSGLLNKKEKAAKDEKIQVVKWSQNLLQKWTGIYELLMKQAASEIVREAKSFKVVGLNRVNVIQAIEYILKEDFEEYQNMPMNGINKYFFIRRFFLWSYLFVPLLILFITISKFDILLLVIMLYFIAIWGSYLAYKKRKYGISDNVIKINGGVFGRSSKCILTYKIQNFELSQTPFQRRRKLATLTIYTASDILRIPEINYSEAVEIQDFILYKVEKSRKTWM